MSRYRNDKPTGGNGANRDRGSRASTRRPAPNGSNRSAYRRDYDTLGGRRPAGSSTGRRSSPAGARPGRSSARMPRRTVSQELGGGSFDHDAASRSSRDTWLLIVFAVFAVVLFSRLFFLQVVNAQELSGKAQDIRTSDEVIQPKRGAIYDRNGNVLAMSVAATTVYANPKEITNPQATAQELANVLGGTPADYVQSLTKDSTYVYIKRQADVSQGDALKARYDELQQQIDAAGTDQGQATSSNPLWGIHYEDTMKRVYPYGAVAGQIIGYVGVDGEGLSGLEKYYDDVLAGVAGHRTVEHGKHGIQIPGGTKVDKPALDGKDIMISIDVNLQKKAEDTLLAYAQESQTAGGEITIVDGKTGEIYCTASLPYYDLSDVSKAAEGASTLKTVSSIYEPGSAFKSVTAAVLLEEGVTTPDEVITVPGYLDYGAYQITDAHDHDTQDMSFAQIIEQSSNIGVSILEDRLGTDTFARWLDKLGFGCKTGVDYPGETAGILADYNLWSEVQESNIAFGQGVSVSSIQLASFYGMLANDGVRVQPHFLIGYPGTGQTVDYDSQRLLSDRTCSQLTTMLTGVVESGTGTMAAIEGYEVAGKTGTSQKIQEDGTYSDGAYIIDFAGYLAHTNSELACIVAMDNPMMSSSMPVFAEVMRYAIDLYSIVPNATADDAGSGDDAPYGEE